MRSRQKTSRKSGSANSTAARERTAAALAQRLHVPALKAAAGLPVRDIPASYPKRNATAARRKAFAILDNMVAAGAPRLKATNPYGCDASPSGFRALRQHQRTISLD
jgi:hypothetical protein